MMNVGDLALEDLDHRLQGEGIVIRAGYFVTRIQTDLPELAAPIKALYQDFPLLDDPSLADYHVAVRSQPRWRTGWVPHAEFLLDGDAAFRSFERPLALAFLEWGLNRCIYSNAHQFLIFHAAVVDRGGRAILLPGQPGSGKSTLCAALAFRGWRMLSDELALLRPQDSMLVPVPRAISLKNQSIDVIRSFAPTARFGPIIENTHKGTTAHVLAPAESVQRADELSRPAWVVFPRYMEAAKTRLQKMSKARAFFWLVDNAFNYDILGAQGFRIACNMIDRCDCYELTYASLDEAVAQIHRL